MHSACHSILPFHPANLRVSNLEDSNLDVSNLHGRSGPTYCGGCSGARSAVLYVYVSMAESTAKLSFEVETLSSSTGSETSEDEYIGRGVLL